MSPHQVAALGPELLPWAGQYTDDLNEAHFLVHQVVSRLTRTAGVDDGPIGIDDARTVMSAVARKNGIAGGIAT